MIKQAGDLNSRAAGIFGISLDQLLVKPIHFHLESMPAGYLGSMAGSSPDMGNPSTDMYMGVFPDWSGEPLNDSAYLHELGHIISLMPNPALPPIYNELAPTTLMLETVADLLALVSTGHVMEPDPSLPSCMKQVREIEDYQSYAAPSGYFSGDFAGLRLLKCCQYLDDSHSQTPHSQSVCNFERDGLAELLKEGKPMPKFDSTPFSAQYCSANIDQVDPHQIGIPISSFLKDLKDQTPLDIRLLFLQSMREASSLPPSVKVQCTIPKQTALIPAQTEPRIRSRIFSPELRYGLPS